MGINFPASPSVGQKYPASPVAGLPTYTYDGEKWTTTTSAIEGYGYVLKSGDTMEGHLSLPTGPAAANAVRKDYVDAATVTATATEYINNTAPTELLTSGAVWGAGALSQVTDAATVVLDFSIGIDFNWTLTAAGRTLANPTNVKAGQKGIIYINQDATGGRTITTWGSAWKFPGGTKPTLSTAAGSSDVISYAADDNTWIACTFSADFK